MSNDELESSGLAGWLSDRSSASPMVDPVLNRPANRGPTKSAAPAIRATATRAEPMAGTAVAHLILPECPAVTANANAVAASHNMLGQSEAKPPELPAMPNRASRTALVAVDSQTRERAGSDGNPNTASNPHNRAANFTRVASEVNDDDIDDHN